MKQRPHGQPPCALHCTFNYLIGFLLVIIFNYKINKSSLTFALWVPVMQFQVEFQLQDLQFQLLLKPLQYTILLQQLDECKKPHSRKYLYKKSVQVEPSVQVQSSVRL